MHGERSVWPLMAFIRTRCMIELALDRGKYIFYLKRRRGTKKYLAVLRLKAMNVEREPVVVRSRYMIENKQRARSMH